MLEQVLAVVPPGWNVETCFDGRSSRDLLSKRNVRLAVIDDDALAEGERGWLLDQAHYRTPDASIVYIASHHTPELERTIRVRGVLYYTSKPVDFDRVGRVVRGVFERETSKSNERRISG